MKIEVILKPCPWCRQTPDIWMPISEPTWCWKILCMNLDCNMRPSSPHVAIRNTTKKNFYQFHNKLENLAFSWNGGNPFRPYEMKVIDLKELPELASLNEGAEYLCNRDPWFKRIDAI